MPGLNIGLRQARRLAELSPTKRLDFIADGLPVIFDSARSLLQASTALAGREREADILRGFAEEESAKALILIDVIRCPTSLVAAKLPQMIRWFYDHLARLIYAEAAHMRPGTTAQLQEYVDYNRKTHYLDGDYGEYIAPNSQLFARESKLYADIAAYEDKELFWSAPSGSSFPTLSFDPAAYSAVEALDAVGAFTKPGLQIVANTWRTVEFSGEIGAQESDTLIKTTLQGLSQASLVQQHAGQQHVNALYGSWQFPMYNIDFSKIEVSMDELTAERDGMHPGY